ncbi:hypothetical protein BDC45DRAFT_132271 [Circinella umbellata]|nr:hypothetical protein BDC45DRAFT_132271 [Circinella umbellata]
MLNVFAIKNLTEFMESSKNPVKSNKVHELLESLCDQQCSTPQSSFSTDKQAANASSYNVNFTNPSSPFFGDGKPPATNTDVHISNNSRGMINYGDHVTYNDSRVVYEKEKGDRETGKRELQKANDNVAQKEVKRIKPNQVYTMLPNDIGSSSLVRITLSLFFEKKRCDYIYNNENDIDKNADTLVLRTRADYDKERISEMHRYYEVLALCLKFFQR